MRYRLILPIAALVAALLAVPAAQAKPKVGLSEQNPAMFDSASWKPLKLKRVPLHRPVGLREGRVPARRGQRRS